ncbi:MAG: hypothetical protein WEA79_11140 [Balneolaceae bacterium]
MQNSLPHISPQLLSGNLSDAISSGYADVKIIDRFPKSGYPPPGIPFSITVQVQTYKTGGAALFRTPFACLDAFIAVRDVQTKEVLAGNFIRTDIVKNCRGTARIEFEPSYRPLQNSQAQLELYEGGTTEWFSSQTTLEDVISGKLDPIAVSRPISLYVSLDEGRKAGLFEEKEDSFFESIDTEFLGSTVNKVLIVAGLGIGAYLLTPLFPAVRVGTARIASKFKQDEDEL